MFVGGNMSRTTSPTQETGMKILAIDLGKSKSVACVYSVETAESRFYKVGTSPGQLHELILKVRPDRIVNEVCSAAGWVADLVGTIGIELQVANTAAPAWRWSNTKRKTDRDDALRLAQLSALEQLPRVTIPKRHVRQWRALIRYRHHLVRRRTQLRNRIRALFDREGLTLPTGKQCWRNAGIAMLHEWARSLDEAPDQELWRGELACELEILQIAELLIARVEAKLDRLAEANTACQLLQSIPGVGPRLAEIVVAVLDDASRFQKGKQVGSYAGLTPRQYQSGDCDRQGRISRQGNPLLRSLLVEVSWVGLQYNPWMRAVYEQVRRGSPTRKKIAIVAVARRLLIRCWAMLRDGVPWRPPNTEPIPSRTCGVVGAY
jgi:transposase